MAAARRSTYDVVVVGGGHNGLVAAAYLARAGRSVLVLERLPHTGGAAVSAQAFRGRPERLSRYSYLVGLMPEELVADLDLPLRLRPRPTASYTPVERGGRPTGLLVEHPEGAATRASFRDLTGSEEEYDAWCTFHERVGDLAQAVAPTLLQPLPREQEVRRRVDPDTWQDLVAAPLGQVLRRTFADEVVRGVVATDALIGTSTSLDDPSLRQNRCFLYHVVGNGGAQWQVPVGGMGAVTDALLSRARAHGTDVVTGAQVHHVDADEERATVTWHDGVGHRSVTCRTVLANVAPQVLEGLLGRSEEAAARPRGAQLKINMVLDRLPRLRSGADPATAFAGTVHLGESWSELEAAYGAAAAGRLPDRLPGEVYCHSLTDPSILGHGAGDTHTLTYFGLHTPVEAFAEDPVSAREVALERALAALDEHLLDPVRDCLARDLDGTPCLEVMTPLDIEAELAMPGGHIFHGDLEWPWAPNRAGLDSPAARWGVATGVPRVLLCGSGARRGGAVSGIGGHNAARAVLEADGDRGGE